MRGDQRRYQRRVGEAGEADPDQIRAQSGQDRAPVRDVLAPHDGSHDHGQPSHESEQLMQDVYRVITQVMPEHLAQRSDVRAGQALPVARGPRRCEEDDRHHYRRRHHDEGAPKRPRQ